MQIRLAEIGKKFNRDWIFKGINYTFEYNTITAIHGANGSGKSTLLKIIAAAEIPSKGQITFIDDFNNSITLAEAYQHISFIGPYVELPELLSIKELYEFQVKFRPLKLDFLDFAKKVMLENDINKLIKNYSSGMRQRLKLGLSILNDSPILFLDEPCSNLDQSGTEMYKDLLINNSKGRTIIIGSNNDKNETFMATNAINIMNYK